VGVKGRPALKADNFTAICEPNCVEKMWDPRRLTTLWAFTGCYRIALPFFTFLGDENMIFPYKVNWAELQFSGFCFNDDISVGRDVQATSRLTDRMSYQTYTYVGGFLVCSVQSPRVLFPSNIFLFVGFFVG
jgi:hypothetical protein